MKATALLLLMIGFIVSGDAMALTVPWIEQASISIDGDLSDWEGLPVAEIPISNVVPRFHAPSGPGDLSASFQMFADKGNLYVAFRVRDDERTFGKEGFSTTWRQDCVEIYFDGDLVDVQKDTYDANDGQIRISSEDGHEAIMEGVMMVGDTPTQLPLLWEALGVVSAVQCTPEGYTVEVQIPATVVGRASLHPGERVGLNVRVIDVDRDYALKVVSWQPDVHSTSWLNTRSIVPVQFLDDVSPGEDQPASVVLGGTHPADLRVTIGGSEDSSLRRALIGLAQGDVASAEPALEEVLQTSSDPKVRAWACYTLGYGKLKRGNHGAAIPYLERLLSQDAEQIGLMEVWMKVYGKLDLAWCYFWKMERGRALDLLLEAAQDIRPDDLRALYRIGSSIYAIYQTMDAIYQTMDQNTMNMRPDVESFICRYNSEFPSKCQNAIQQGGHRAYVGHFLLGAFYYRQLNFDRARQHFEVCARMDPQNPDPDLLIGHICQAEGEYGEAVESYNNAFKATAFTPEHHAQAVLGLAHSYYNLGDREKTIAVIDTNLSKLPEEAKLSALLFLKKIQGGVRYEGTRSQVP